MFLQALHSSQDPTSAMQSAAKQAVQDADEGKRKYAQGVKLLVKGQDAAWKKKFTFPTGTFQEVALGDMRGKASGGTSALWFAEGKHPVLDVAYLQATAPKKCVFQVASQFNALEAPDPYGLVRPADYVHDNTQGPRASVSAYGALLLRHYSAPGPYGPFEQRTDDWQINLLSRVSGEGLADVVNGYLLPSNIHNASAFEQMLSNDFEQIKVGVHTNVQVAFGANWFGPVHTNETITQVFTSTIAGGDYGSLAGAKVKKITQHLLDAAYMGTLLHAATAGQEIVVLTLIGGGVFGNPLSQILSAIEHAFDHSSKYSRKGMTVLVNCRDGVPSGASALAAQRNGGVIKISSSGLVKIT